MTGNGSAAFVVAHNGSNNMITFRYKLKNVPMKVAEQSFTADGVTFPAGSLAFPTTLKDVRPIDWRCKHASNTSGATKPPVTSALPRSC